MVETSIAGKCNRHHFNVFFNFQTAKRTNNVRLGEMLRIHPLWYYNFSLYISQFFPDIAAHQVLTSPLLVLIEMEAKTENYFESLTVISILLPN